MDCCWMPERMDECCTIAASNADDTAVSRVRYSSKGSAKFASAVAYLDSVDALDSVKLQISPDHAPKGGIQRGFHFLFVHIFHMNLPRSGRETC